MKRIEVKKRFIKSKGKAGRGLRHESVYVKERADKHEGTVSLVLGFAKSLPIRSTKGLPSFMKRYAVMRSFKIPAGSFLPVSAWL
ncbi:hypothetical protein PO124_30285 [Bacillus licheniformis]|nr:hypothetical protein [Bacillus licheniformis]